MRKFFVVLFLFGFCSPAVFASDHLAAKIDGEWVGTGRAFKLDMTLIVLDVESGIIALNLTVASSSCSGHLVGLGKLKDNVLKLRPYKKLEDAQACSVTMTFDKSGKKALVSENSCGYYHGAECLFSGVMEKQGVKQKITGVEITGVVTK